MLGSLNRDTLTIALAILRWLLPISLSIVSCRASDPVPQCPAGFAENDNRANRLWERLGKTSAAAALMARSTSKPRICFGPTDLSAITTERVIYFDHQLDESEGAAKLGHLFLHFVDGMPMSNPTPADCKAQVDEALRAEAAAFSLELQLRRELAVTTKKIVYEFDAQYWAAVPDARERLVFDYLQAHPDGAPGIDALAAGYAKQCRKSTKP